MRGTHVVAYFKAPDNVADLFTSGDRIMDALLDAESDDPTVTDGTVSVDADLGIVEVEAYAPDHLKSTGEPLILNRINTAVQSTVGLANELADQRVVENA